VRYDAIIIGGGAAGLFCAIEAGKRRKKVLVIERNHEVGRKIIISGGGRCNFTNINTASENFISENPHFCKSALSRYSPLDFVGLVKKHKIAYFEKTLGQLFCRDSSRQIVDMLLSECRAARVEIKTGCRVANIAKAEHFTVETDQGSFEAANLVMASGGLSFPKIGATDLGYRVARQFGLRIVETRPSLVALVLEGEAYKQLAGVSIESVVTAGTHSFRENILFTHRGLSGPAVLQISNYWQKSEPVSIDLMPDIDASAFLEQGAAGRQNLNNYLAGVFPKRFADEFARREFGNKPLYQMNDKETETIRQKLKAWNVRFRETEGYGRAEVTLGGVSTAELSSQTMGSKKVPGLYFIGEVVDVTGWLGGYNFQWAWASAYAAGNAI
jgi:predicted Rossmann fold flavoprotein